MASHGRGGAGNMITSEKSPRLDPADLETPTLKTPVVTTGRGGTGNMARNVDPAETRARQDVNAYVGVLLLSLLFSSSYLVLFVLKQKTTPSTCFSLSVSPPLTRKPHLSKKQTLF